jgi:hypothetical protein
MLQNGLNTRAKRAAENFCVEKAVAFFGPLSALSEKWIGEM